MNVINVTTARKEIYHLLDEVNSNHQPIQVQGKNNSAVMVGKEDWDAIQETLYLLSIPTMRESIIEGLKAPLEQCSDTITW